MCLQGVGNKGVEKYKHKINTKDGKTQMANKNELVTIYGSKVSKDGKKAILTLVNGHDEDKTFYTACVKLDNSGAVQVKVDKAKGIILFKVKLLKQDKKTETQALDNDDF